MQKNINYGTPRVVKVILNDGKFSIFKTDAPEEEIKKYLERFCKITERSIGMFFQNFLLEGHTVQVLYLSNNQALIASERKSYFISMYRSFTITKL